MRLLLINPKCNESFWSFKWAVNEIVSGKRAVNPPLGLATLAALCPAGWTVEIIDENIEPVPVAPQADLIGIGGMGVQFGRQQELLKFYRQRGYFVVAGGSYASLCPELYTPLANTVIAGEAEYIWKRFCSDFETGVPLSLYKESGTVDLQDSPPPRFDLLKLEKYTTVTLQFSRGCPYRCEFCDIIVMFGRKPRHKSLQQVGRELDELRWRNIRNVFFVDDNLIGHKAVAKALLHFLKQYQEQHHYHFRFGTQTSLNLAQDPELLQLFRAANFSWVFIGIESPDAETLKATWKVQNTREDPLTAVRKIYAYGIDVLAGFIVGFDNDTPATFEKQYQFIMHSGIQIAMIGLLTALPRTPLYERLQAEERLLPEMDNTDNTKPGTNFIPKGMLYDVMVDAYKALYQRLVSDRDIADRIRNKTHYLVHPIYQGDYSFEEKRSIVGRFLVKGLLPGGPSRLFHFLRTLPLLSPKKMPVVILDWINGLTMQDYVKRYFVKAVGSQGTVVKKLSHTLQAAVAPYVHAGKVTVALRPAVDAVPDLSIKLKGYVDHGFFARAAQHLEKFLRQTSSTITLWIEEFREEETPDLDYLLQRLARYGDRIFIVVDKKLRNLVPIDSSVFNVVLEEQIE